MFIFPAVYAQECVLSSSYRIEQSCEISDSQAQQLQQNNANLQLANNIHVTRNGDLSLRSINTDWDYASTINISGLLTLSEFPIIHANINGNTSITTVASRSNAEDRQIIGSNFRGNLLISESSPANDILNNSYNNNASFAILSYKKRSQTAETTLVKQNFSFNTNNIAIRKEEGVPKATAEQGYSRFAAMQLGATDGRHAEFSYSPIRFIVEGNSHIALTDNQYTGSEPNFSRSAVGVNHQRLGSVLVLAEKLDETKHAAEKYKTKIFLGENSKISTQADYSHGIALSSNYFTLSIEPSDNNQIFIENKGEIRVAKQASAISGYFYRLYAAPDNEPVGEIEWRAKQVDGEELFKAYYAGNPPDHIPIENHPYREDPNLLGNATFIAPSLLSNKDYLERGKNLAILFAHGPYPEDPEEKLNSDELGRKDDEFLAYAKKHFNADETAIEIHNSGKLIAPQGYVFSGSEFKDLFFSTDGELTGKLVLNNGSDEVSLTNTNIQALTEINGAETIGRQRELAKSVKLSTGYRYEIASDQEDPGTITTITASGAINEITSSVIGEDEAATVVLVDIPQANNRLNLNQDLRGSSQSAGAVGNSKILNWDIINLGKESSAHLILTGDLNDGWDSLKTNPEFSADFESRFNPNLRQKSLNIGRLGKLSLDENTTSAKVSYNVTNAGIIDLSKNRTPNNQLTIDGNYLGEEGSKLLLDSQWNNPDQQHNDKLIITGNAAGTTSVQAPAGIIGDVTIADNQIKNGLFNAPVIEVQGRADGQVFTGKGVTTNAGEAQLVKTEKQGKVFYHWTLVGATAEIMNKPVTAYVQADSLAKELGFISVGRLDQRLGELVYRSQPQTWLRVRSENATRQGQQRFGFKAHHHLIQVGQDLALVTEQNKITRLGLFFGYAKTRADFFDKYRQENGVVLANKFTTQAKLTALSLGGYYNQLYQNGFYTDWLAQISQLNIQYVGEAQAKQKGYSFASSIELGYPIALNDDWTIEPQSQLIYQHLKLSAFSDAEQRKISKQSSDNLRLRLGMRLIAYKQAYIAAHLHYDLFGNQSRVQVGRSKVEENYGRFFAEISLGAQFNLAKNLNANFEAHYARSLNQNHNAIIHQSRLNRSQFGGQLRFELRF